MTTGRINQVTILCLTTTEIVLRTNSGSESIDFSSLIAQETVHLSPTLTGSQQAITERSSMLPPLIDSVIAPFEALFLYALLLSNDAFLSRPRKGCVSKIESPSNRNRSVEVDLLRITTKQAVLPNDWV